MNWEKNLHDGPRNGETHHGPDLMPELWFTIQADDGSVRTFVYKLVRMDADLGTADYRCDEA